jgi:hypothetical protein
VKKKNRTQNYSMEGKYWNKRDELGGTRSEGSISINRDWKWEIIHKYSNDLNDLIDVGYGDLSFWEWKDCDNYIGIDISQFNIQKNRNSRKNWKFICNSADVRQAIKAKTGFCLYMLFHIMDGKVYEQILENLAFYSGDVIFIYTWKENLFNTNNDKKKIFKNQTTHGRFSNALKALYSKNCIKNFNYQTHRIFLKYLYIFNKNNFVLANIEKNKNISDIGAMYIFKKCGYNDDTM